jgi:hypothetical protein
MEIVAKIIFINILQAKNSEIQLQDTKADPATSRAIGRKNLLSFFIFILERYYKYPLSGIPK